MKVILDPMNGSSGTEVFRTLEAAGVEIIALNLIVNGNFPEGAPNPIGEGRMDKAILLAKNQKDSIVIGLDGDGDRIVFGDKNGLFSAGTSMIAILTRLKSADKSTLGKALCDPKVDPPSLDYWSKIGYEPILFRNGHSQIKDYMLTQDIAVAAEESGHYYHKIKKGNINAYCENSLLTILLFLKSIYEDPELLSIMRSNERKVYTSGEINYKFPSDINRDAAISHSVTLLSDDNAIISKTTIAGIDLQGIAFMKGINQITKRIEEEDWYSGFYRISTNEKSIARFYLSSGIKKRLNLLSEQIRNICEKDLCGKKVE